MKTQTNNRRVVTLLVAACMGVTACDDDDAQRAGAEAPADAVAAGQAAAALIAQIGVEPGPVQQAGGALALLAKLEGAVEVRRLGEESFAPAKQDLALYLGDQVRAGDDARATLVFADQSTVELAEVSTLAVGSRVATADPASSAAVLGGVARFSVAPRAPGEGPFLVFTSAGVVATKGTVFGVGVAADGDARVGVESGAVEVASAARFDAPVTLEAAAAIELAGSGGLSAPATWTQDDWGTWRDQAEAELDLNATAALHGKAMADIASELEGTYALTADLGSQLSAFEAKAAAEASASDSASYQASLPAATLAIEASFLAALRLEYLTHAYLSHAVLAADLYVRHPEISAWAELEPRVHASVLWPKRFDLLANAYFEPLRVQYYLHHPRGRAHARWVGLAVPAFYANISPPAVPRAELEAKLKFKAFAPPTPNFTASARALWIASPSADWQANANLLLAPPRGKLAFYVRPPKFKAKAVLGAEIKGKLGSVFAVQPPKARGKLEAKWGVALGQHLRLAPPDLQAAAQARAQWKAEPPALDADAKLAARGKLERPDVKGKLRGQMKTKLAAGTKLEANGKARVAEAKAAAKGKGQGGASAKLEIKPPAIKAEAKGSASFKLGR